MSHMLIVFVAICSVLCFAKENFQVIVERIEESDVDPEIINASIGVTKFNRTCKAVSCNFTLHKDLGYDVKVEVTVFALYSNEYRRTPILFTRNLCDFYKMEYLWAKKQIDKYSHFPYPCPVRAVRSNHDLLDYFTVCTLLPTITRNQGDYYLKDFILDGTDFPATANIPWTSVMIHFRIFYKDSIYYGVKLYLTLDHDVELKRMG